MGSLLIWSSYILQYVTLIVASLLPKFCDKFGQNPMLLAMEEERKVAARYVFSNETCTPCGSLTPDNNDREMTSRLC